MTPKGIRGGSPRLAPATPYADQAAPFGLGSEDVPVAIGGISGF